MGRDEPWAVPSPWIGRATLPKIWRLRRVPKRASSISYVVRVLGFHEQAYIARDRSDINPGTKEAEELGTFPGTLNLV